MSRRRPPRRAGVAPDGAGSPDRADRGPRAREGDALVLPRLRDERDRRPGAARRARRPQAGPPPRPLRDARPRPAADPAVPQVRLHRRRGDGQVPPPRRLGDLRHAGADGAGLLPALPAGRRPGQLRLDRRRPGSRDEIHRGPPRPASRPSCCATSTPTRSTSAPTTTSPSASRWSCPRGSRTCSSTAPPASRSAWRPTSRPTTCARSPARSPPTSTTRDRPRGPDGARQGPRLPRRRHHGAARASARPTHRAAAASRSAPAPTSSR